MFALQVLRHALLLSVAFALLHLVPALRRRALPSAEFVLLGSAASVLLGLYAVRAAIVGEAHRSMPVALAWTMALGLGFFATGAVLAVAWLAVTRGGASLLSRLRRRAPPGPRPRPGRRPGG